MKVYWSKQVDIWIRNKYIFICFSRRLVEWISKESVGILVLYSTTWLLWIFHQELSNIQWTNLRWFSDKDYYFYRDTRRWNENVTDSGQIKEIFDCSEGISQNWRCYDVVYKETFSVPIFKQFTEISWSVVVQALYSNVETYFIKRKWNANINKLNKSMWPSFRKEEIEKP